MNVCVISSQGRPVEGHEQQHGQGVHSQLGGGIRPDVSHQQPRGPSLSPGAELSDNPGQVDESCFSNKEAAAEINHL